MLFIDPGDVHVGHAVFTEVDDGWLCTETFETSPEESELFVKEAMERDSFGVIGFERFKLFGHLALAQTGSEFRASQMIGVVKFLYRTLNPECELVTQDPSCQPIAQALAEKRGVPLKSVLSRTGGHSKSAELHGVFYLARNDHALSVANAKVEK